MLEKTEMFVINKEIVITGHRREGTGGHSIQTRYAAIEYCSAIARIMRLEYTVGFGRESRGIGDLRTLKDDLEEETECTVNFEYVCDSIIDISKGIIIIPKRRSDIHV